MGTLDFFLLGKGTENKKLDWDFEEAKLKIYKFVAIILIGVIFTIRIFFLTFYVLKVIFILFFITIN